MSVLVPSVNIHLNKNFCSGIIYFYSYIIFNLFKKIYSILFYCYIIIKSVLISAIFLELYIYIHFPHVNIYNPTINKSTKQNKTKRRTNICDTLELVYNWKSDNQMHSLFRN